MKPIRHDSTTCVLGAPKDWDEEKNGPCQGLPVSERDGQYSSYWKPTRWELLKLLFGQPVRLCVAAKWHPAVWIDVES